MKPQAARIHELLHFLSPLHPTLHLPPSCVTPQHRLEGALALTSILLRLPAPLSEASRAEGHGESLSTSEKRLILFAPTLTGPLILQVYLSSEHLAPLTTWPALLSALPR